MEKLDNGKVTFVYHCNDNYFHHKQYYIFTGIEKVLHKMTLEFDLLPSIYTLKSHILPYMQSSADDVLASFINAHVEYHVALNAILMHLLSENKIREASKFCK